MAVLSTLLPTAGVAYAIQTAFAIPACMYQTEKYYDLSGGLTFLAATGYGLCLPAIRRGIPLRAAVRTLLSSTHASSGAGPIWNWRHLILGGMITFWSSRLSSHLFTRIKVAGHDSRFDDIKTKPQKFLVAWFFQALWVVVCTLPLTAVISVPASALARCSLTGTDMLGLALWVGGFVFEVVADRQKWVWQQAKRRKEHDEDFLTSGLWSRCRYPNYFGEVTLWVGAATLAAGTLIRSPVLTAMGWEKRALARMGAVMLPFLSPAFAAFLLLKVSGVPMSQPKYDRKFGHREDYRKWRDSTPLFFPRMF